MTTAERDMMVACLPLRVGTCKPRSEKILRVTVGLAAIDAAFLHVPNETNLDPGKGLSSEVAN